MGLLRTDRVTGLGGANAISGSVYFTGGTTGPIITISHSQDFAFDTSDFTIEFWIKKQNGSNRVPVFAQQAPNGTDDYGCWIELNADNTIEFQDQESGAFASTGTIKEDTWTHVAMVRDSNTLRWFIDGVASGTSSYSGTMKDSKYSLVIGRWGESHYDNYYYAGYISNLRIQKGVAQYTSAFTPPTNRLEKTPETVLLCCQSSSDVTREETGKILVASAPANGAFPQATRHTPNSPVGFSTTTDVGSQYGSTFDGFGSFATSTYMVPPGGNTRERNRGRAVLGGGFDTSPGAQTTDMQFFEVQSQGNTQTFGDLTAARWIPAAYASSTRACFAGGGTPSRVNTIDFVTIANTGNATDFGDLTSTRTYFMGYSSSTRGITAGGGDPSLSDVIDYVTIATTGNATDFGNLTVARQEVMSASSPTRGLTMGGFLTPNPSTDVVDYVTIASTGNATDFGDLTAASGHGAATSDNTRVIFAGGYSPGTTYSNKIEFFTTASTGNGTDFGDLITAVISSYGMPSDNTRGVLCGGFVAPANINSMQQITIQTTGDAVDFGDVTVKKRGNGGTSDSHGGLS